MTKAIKQRPLVGISSCLAGQKVRYDGQDKFNDFIHQFISPYVQLLPFCPESAAGLGIPRPPVYLVQQNATTRAIGRDDPNLDVTEKLVTMGKIITRVYPNLSGYVVQSRSPSCGFNTTPLYRQNSTSTNSSAFANGLFIQQIHQAYPELPIINEAELDSSTAHDFLIAVQNYQARKKL